MGQHLSIPDTRKKSESGSNSRFVYGVTEMQGWRLKMEDSHATVLDLDGPEESNVFFAVYDGHRGGAMANFAGKNVHKRLVTEEAYKERNWETALKNSFLGTDQDFLADPVLKRDPSGCTAVAALLTTDNKIYVANAGDSRSVLSIKGGVKALSFDHKPTNSSEKARISAAGGFVEEGRVNGNLAMSRSLGDFEFKRNNSLSPEAQVITADPEVTCHEITEEDEFLVIASDGIWDCLTSQQVVNLVRYQASEGTELTKICEKICDLCLLPDSPSSGETGCDNMTIIIVGITHGRSLEQWHEWIKDRVTSKHGFETPSTPPRLYVESRLAAFKVRKEVWDAREKRIAEEKAAEEKAAEEKAAETEDGEAKDSEPSNTSDSGDPSDNHTGGITVKIEQLTI